ncbi:hypothetical protein ACI8AF_01600 [Blastococcus sp. SYSU D00669]
MDVGQLHGGVGLPLRQAALVAGRPVGLVERLTTRTAAWSG